jgi:hypothetical protein
MDKSVSTDYNLDDPEVGLGGWANHGARHMHLLVSVVKVSNPEETKLTLIHEASHLSNPSVVDLGYYASHGFEAMTEDEKVCNAAHYEELPARKLGKSSFPGTFTPGKLAGGGTVTAVDLAKREASEYLRKAWDAAVDVHSSVRGVRKRALKGDKKVFGDNRAFLLEVSQNMNLTIHTQAAAFAKVTALDVTITESIAHAMTNLQDLAEKQPTPAGPLSVQGMADKIVGGAVAAYANLLGDPGKDKALLDWLVLHYHAVPSP